MASADKDLRQVAEKLVEAFEASSVISTKLHSEVQDIRNELHGSDIQQTKMEVDLSQVKEILDKLVKIVKDGNGAQPVVTQLEFTKRDIDEIKKWIKERKETDIEQVRGRWQFLAVALTATLGLLTAVATAVISLWK